MSLSPNTPSLLLGIRRPFSLLLRSKTTLVDVVESATQAQASAEATDGSGGATGRATTSNVPQETPQNGPQDTPQNGPQDTPQDGPQMSEQTTQNVPQMSSPTTQTIQTIQTTQTTQTTPNGPAAGTRTSPADRSVVNTKGSSPTSATGNGVFAGHATYYNPGMGACGMVHTDSDYIVAVGDMLYEQYTPDGNPNHNTLCGAKLIAHYEGKSVEVTVVDRCGSCSPNDLDLSPVAFAQIANQGLGIINLTWEWA
ncbi:hypothetical protein JCM33374_g3534 [Metschnikowia sp. JCM 33374]|nr:hypothetical protein JCM33374_g3534 [Metschnikowia sp. JCM 33374]